MPITITALYAGLNAIIVVFLGMRVARLRHRRRIGIGAGGDVTLERAIRVHGNAVENVPLALILLAVLELNGVDAPLVHGLGIALTAGRVLHAWGLAQSSGASFGRVAGMLLTWAPLIAALATALRIGIRALLG